MSFSSYQPPGVYITEQFSPNVTPNLVSPDNLVIVGMPSQDVLTYTEVVTISALDTPIVLPYLDAINSGVYGSVATLLGITSVRDYYGNLLTYPTTIADDQALPESTVTVTSTYGFPSSGTISIAGVTGNITYTGITPTTFTGCTGGSGTSGASAVVTLVPPTGWNYVEGVNADYTFSVDPTSNPGTITFTASPTSSPTAYAGQLVQVTYTYATLDFWDPITLYNIQDVETRFGTSWSSAAGTANQFDPVPDAEAVIGSPLSMAARLAFANGAQSVICQPFFVIDSISNLPRLPTVTDGTTELSVASNWFTSSGGNPQGVLANLQSIINQNMIVPVIGAYTNSTSVNPNSAVITQNEVTSVLEAVQQFLYSEDQLGVNLIGFFGLDTTQGEALSYTSIRNIATALQSNGTGLSSTRFNSQNVLFNNTNFQISNSLGATPVGGQYFAAAFAGALCARAASQSMTRQYVVGFSGMSDTRTTSDKNLDAQNSLCVVENFNGGLRIRHGITLDNADGTAYQEISVVRSKFYLVASIQQTLDNQVIGQIIADANSPVIVSSVITGVLGQLQSQGTIVSFSPVAAQISSLNPTIIQASFSYSPAFPLNYIDITFSMDLTAGTITATTGTT